jgi:hypothetical protein
MEFRPYESRDLPGVLALCAEAGWRATGARRSPRPERSSERRYLQSLRGPPTSRVGECCCSLLSLLTFVVLRVPNTDPLSNLASPSAKLLEKVRAVLVPIPTRLPTVKLLVEAPPQVPS